MRKSPLVLAAALTVVTAGCYRDFDFTADAKADYAVVDMNGNWVDLGNDFALAGAAEDQPVPGDWNGDHFWDRAVLKPNGDWVTTTPDIGTIHYPAPADLPEYDDHPFLSVLPVPADYNGDGKTEPAWYRESDGTWFISTQAQTDDLGTGPTTLPGTGTVVTDNDYDFPVPADYDGDGRDDVAVFNPGTRVWRVRMSSTPGAPPIETTMDGNATNPIPVPADYGNVGHAQRAVYGPEGWNIENGAMDPFGSEASGSTVGLPAPADYNGDGAADLSYVDWYSGTWSTKGSATTVTVDFGQGQLPLAAGRNLELNLFRIGLVGGCVADPDSCTGGGG
jgi:hypothetical protein